jgi:hypothetical protein
LAPNRSYLRYLRMLIYDVSLERTCQQSCKIFVENI